MSDSPKNVADVVDISAFKRSQVSRYDATTTSVLESLEPVAERGHTIISGEHLSEEQIELFSRILTNNRDLWVIEITTLAGEKTKIFRGDLPFDR